MTTIQTHKGGLVLVTVPKESTCRIVDKESMPVCLMVTKPNGQSYPKSLPVGEYRLLGEITSEGAQFDCSGLVEQNGNNWFADYKQSVDPNDNTPHYYTFTSPIKSFITLLESNGIYLKNQMGEKYIALLKVQ